MENESNEGIIPSEKDEDVEEEEQSDSDTEESDEQEEKPTETPEAKLARLKRQTAQLEKKLGIKDDPKPSKEKQVVKKSDELDHGQKAFLRTYDIKGADELQLVKDWMKRTGDDLDTLVEDDIFLSRLGKLRDAKAAADAVPKSTRRSQQSAKNDVEYWTQKIESGQATLNDIDDVSVRRQVLNARVEHERVGSRFSDSPIQMS